ncbi:sensor domain-containing diguanylate cyclase, partial [Methylogaea oryzae]
MLFILVLLALTSSVTTAYSVVPWASEAFIVPVMLLLAIHFAGKGGEIYSVMAALSLVYGIAMCITARRNHASFNDSRRYGLENEKLAESLAQSEHKYRLILDSLQDVLYQTDLDGRITYVSPSIEQLLGYAPETVVGMQLGDLYADAQGYPKLLDELAGSTGSGAAGHRAEFRHRNGSAIWTATNAHLYRDKEGNIAGVEGAVRDISENKRLEDELWQLANFDALTGIPGRRLFYDRLEVCLAQAGRSGIGGALMFIDLDDFKIINDELGHDAGDQYLCEVANRLLEAVRQSDTVARIGGDEFTVLLPDVGGAAKAGVALQKIQDALARPMLLDGR